MRSREAGPTLGDQAGLPHPVLFHSDLLSASQSDRTIMGIHAQARQPQQDASATAFSAAMYPETGTSPAIMSPTTVASSTQKFSGSRVSRLYLRSAARIGSGWTSCSHGASIGVG